MDNGPLVTEEIDAGAELIRQFDQYAPIKAAFWLRASGDDARYLYLASDQVRDTNLYEAYGEVVRLIDQIDNPYLSIFRVKIIYGTNPLALSAAEINEQYPNRFGTRLKGQTLGNLIIEDVYIYPPSVLVATS